MLIFNINFPLSCSTVVSGVISSVYNTLFSAFATSVSAKTSLILNSYEVHRAGRNNLWGMVGAGGSLFSTLSAKDGDPSSVSDVLNGHLADAINQKVDAGEASPMGMVFVNFVTDTEGQKLIEAIIRMNSRFELGRKTDNNDTPTPVQSAKEGYSSGFNVDTENWKAF